MRLNVLILLSVLGYASTDKLQVKCGDELCEKPSNRAVTTLRYSPDKPYKLQINSVNSEVDIFGATDDLFYIRYGRNYGFLPKNHLREKARGNFLHSVEIDFASLKINQEVRETNYLHEFLKASTTSSQPIESSNNNENIIDSNEAKENTKPSEEIAVEKIDAVEERATDYIPIGTEPKIEQPIAKPDETTTVPPPTETSSSDEANDSGVEDDDEGDEDDDEEEEEEEETDSEDEGKLLKKPDNSTEPAGNINEQPNLIDVPPHKDVIEEVKPTSAENATLPQKKAKHDAPEEIQSTINEPNTKQSIEFEPGEKEKISEEEIIKQPGSDDTAKNDTQPIDAEEKPNNDQLGEKKVERESIELPDLKGEEQNNTAPAPVTEEIVEDIPKETTVSEPDVIKVVETTELPKIESTTQLPLPETSTQAFKEEITTQSDVESEANKIIDITESTTKVPEVLEDKTTVSPEVLEDTTTVLSEVISEVPEIDQDVKEELPHQVPKEEKHEQKFDEDLLLKRFDEKLGHRGNSEKHVHKESHDHYDHDHSFTLNQNHEVHDHVHTHGHDNAGSEHVSEEQEAKKEEPGFLNGLFTKIFGDNKDEPAHHLHDEMGNAPKTSDMIDEGFCEKIDSENCPKSLNHIKREIIQEKFSGVKLLSTEEYVGLIMHEAIERMDLIISMALVAVTVLIFTFGYYCISKAKKEGPLIGKINELERHLMASLKENETLKGEIVLTKQKLVSIEDNSFGSNDMVIALKNDLENSEKEKSELMEKITSLEKELEAAAEDGLELNRMVSELLSSQTGSDSIINSVEDLQRQLNEQQETIISMNETLAAKSRENTELQIQLTEINGKCNGELEKYQQNLDAVILERNNLQIELENLKRETDVQVNQIIEERNGEVTRLNNELTSYAAKYDETKKLLNTAEAKVQALEECIETFRKQKGGGIDVKGLLDVADLKADLLAVTKEKSTIQEQLQTERDSRKLLEDRVKTISDEMSNLKKEFVTADKEKLEAQTRLEVLSTYFKEKETQLQQELSVKEARWMKQQGEKTSTVEKIQALNDEIQTLKSQNDSLRAEIEAQAAAHKLNISTTEAQAHSAWLNARQAERKLEESRMEAAALRRRLTSIAENPSGASDLLNGLPGPTNDSMNSIPSPIRVESPNNNNVSQLPPGAPPFLPPPPFLAGAPPFLPPFLPPPGELPPMGMGMPPPLGRLMSPPPKRFTPTMRDDRDRYSPRGRGRYSPDSRYDDDYTAFETETDYSPPRTPTPPRRGYSSPTDRSKKSKGKRGARWSSDSSSSSTSSSTYTDDDDDEVDGDSIHS